MIKFLRRISKIKYFFLLCMLLAIVILPTYEGVSHRIKKTVEISDSANICYVHDGDVIEQEIIVPQKTRLNKLYIHFCASENISGKLRIVISDGTEDIIRIIDSRSLVDNEYREVASFWFGIAPGVWKIRIESAGIGNKDGVGVYMAGDSAYEIPVASTDGLSCTGPLSLRYECLDYGKEFLICLFIYIIMLMSLCVTAYILCVPENIMNSWLLMFSNIVVIVGFIGLIYPSMTYGNMAWAEGVTEFYDHTVNKSAWGCLSSLEGGMYLSEYNSILSVLAFKVNVLCSVLPSLLQGIASSICKIYVGISRCLFCSFDIPLYWDGILWYMVHIIVIALSV